MKGLIKIVLISCFWLLTGHPSYSLADEQYETNGQASFYGSYEYVEEEKTTETTTEQLSQSVLPKTGSKNEVFQQTIEASFLLGTLTLIYLKQRKGVGVE